MCINYYAHSFLCVIFFNGYLIIEIEVGMYGNIGVIKKLPILLTNVCLLCITQPGGGWIILE